jgi:hypothetical protein
MLQIWRKKAINNRLISDDLAESFGGSKLTYLKKLNQALRKKIKQQSFNRTSTNNILAYN